MCQAYDTNHAQGAHSTPDNQTKLHVNSSVEEWLC